LKLLVGVPNNGEPVAICEYFKAGFSVAGHILGASLVLMEMKNARTADRSLIKFLFSGDLGHYDQPIVKNPAPPPSCDYLMVESTYGNRLHGNVSPKDQMARIISEAAKRNAPILIPAFAVGRTQEVLYLIRELEDEKRIPSLPVIVDSPMALQAIQVYSRWTEEHDEEYASILARKIHPLKTDRIRFVSTREKSKRINNIKGARIIISFSGMLTGGRVLHHAIRILPNEDATIVFVGYQASGTRGRQIVEGAREVKIMKQVVPVRCHVEVVEGFSAHADWKGVLRWLEGLPSPPKKVFTTHGEPEASLAMAERIKERFAWEVIIPQYGQTIQLE
jgi:metallo-beta-lactamase family protein